ncbi:MAG: hypothetical protein RLZZ210_1475 [Pseudomonadota bacterium]|jgi:hypothetical protein
MKTSPFIHALVLSKFLHVLNSPQATTTNLSRLTDSNTANSKYANCDYLANLLIPETNQQIKIIWETNSSKLNKLKKDATTLKLADAVISNSSNHDNLLSSLKLLLSHVADTLDLPKLKDDANNLDKEMIANINFDSRDNLLDSIVKYCDSYLLADVRSLTRKSTVIADSTERK